MLAFAPDYDRLPLIAKVEVFEHALQNTEGNDLAKVRVFVNMCLYDKDSLSYSKTSGRIYRNLTSLLSLLVFLFLNPWLV